MLFDPLREAERGHMDHLAHLVDDRSRSEFRRGFWTPTRGVRLPQKRRDLVARCAAVRAVVGPEVQFSGITAVEMWEGIEADDAAVEFTIAGDAHHVRRTGFRCRRRAIDSVDLTELHGFAVTTPQRTFVDVADRLSVPRLVAVGDDFLRRGLMSERDVLRVIDRCSGQRGIKCARRAAEWLDPRAESPRESMVRALLVEGGYPCPIPQFEVRDSTGRFIARIDLGYPDLRIAFEYDGEHHLSRERQAKDAWRRNALAAEDWYEVTVVAEDVRSPQLLYAKADRAIATQTRRLTASAQ